MQQITQALKQLLDEPLSLIAIDGHSAAGKTTLAHAICQSLPATTATHIVHMDDFYRAMPPHEREQLNAEQAYRRYYDWERVAAQVLAPLRRGELAQYQRYDWTTNTLVEWHTVTPNGVVIVEGCYATRPELKPYFDLMILVEAPDYLRARRQAKRADASPTWLARWDAAERHYMQHAQPQRYVHLVIAESNT